MGMTDGAIENYQGGRMSANLRKEFLNLTGFQCIKIRSHLAKFRKDRKRGKMMHSEHSLRFWIKLFKLEKEYNRDVNQDPVLKEFAFNAGLFHVLKAKALVHGVENTKKYILTNLSISNAIFNEF